MGVVVSIVESVDISVDISAVESVVNIPAVNKAEMSFFILFKTSLLTFINNTDLL